FQMTRLLPELARHMGYERRKQNDHRFHALLDDRVRGRRWRWPLRRRADRVKELHDSGDRRVEMKACLDIFGDFLDGSVNYPAQIAQLGRQFDNFAVCAPVSPQLALLSTQTPQPS